MDNQQAFDILNGSTNDTLNESHLSSANGDFNNEPNTPIHKHPPARLEQAQAVAQTE